MFICVDVINRLMFICVDVILLLIIGGHIYIYIYISRFVVPAKLVSTVDTSSLMKYIRGFRSYHLD